MISVMVSFSSCKRKCEHGIFCQRRPACKRVFTKRCRQLRPARASWFSPLNWNQGRLLVGSCNEVRIKAAARHDAPGDGVEAGRAGAMGAPMGRAVSVGPLMLGPRTTAPTRRSVRNARRKQVATLSRIRQLRALRSARLAAGSGLRHRVNLRIIARLRIVQVGVKYFWRKPKKVSLWFVGYLGFSAKTTDGRLRQVGSAHW